MSPYLGSPLFLMCSFSPPLFSFSLLCSLQKASGSRSCKIIRKHLRFWRGDDKQKQLLGRAKLRGQALPGSPCSPHRSPPAPPGPTPPHTHPNLPKLPQKEGKEGGSVPLSQITSRTLMPENPPGNTVRTPKRQLHPHQREGFHPSTPSRSPGVAGGG